MPRVMSTPMAQQPSHGTDVPWDHAVPWGFYIPWDVPSAIRPMGITLSRGVLHPMGRPICNPHSVMEMLAHSHSYDESMFSSTLLLCVVDLVCMCRFERTYVCGGITSVGFSA